MLRLCGAMFELPRLDTELQEAKMQVRRTSENELGCRMVIESSRRLAACFFDTHSLAT
jgi:hypothetical protein